MNSSECERMNTNRNLLEYTIVNRMYSITLMFTSWNDGGIDLSFSHPAMPFLCCLRVHFFQARDNSIEEQKNMMEVKIF